MANTRTPKERDWKRAGEEALTTMLQRANVLAADVTEFKQLESLIKTVGDVVGAGLYLSRSRGTGASDGGGSDDDD